MGGLGKKEGSKIGEAPRILRTDGDSSIKLTECREGSREVERQWELWQVCSANLEGMLIDEEAALMIADRVFGCRKWNEETNKRVQQ